VDRARYIHEKDYLVCNVHVQHGARRQIFKARDPDSARPRVARGRIRRLRRGVAWVGSISN
jgi:hypothetical protein